MSAGNIILLLGFAYLAHAYFGQKSNSMKTPSALITDQPDVRRWHHDGSQPPTDRVGNLQPAVKWPEVERLLS